MKIKQTGFVDMGVILLVLVLVGVLGYAVLKLNDPPTQSLKPPYTKDANGIYYGGRTLVGADPETFQTL